MTERKGSACPFHTIVVTSPDSQSAKAALDGPLHPLSFPPTGFYEYKDSTTKVDESNYDAAKNEDIHVYSTSDPFDTRVGSGGGTLAALDVADCGNMKKDGNSIANKEGKGSVLIIHAGGQSSRCPTQITLGKAWTSLPLENNKITNPTYILMESLSKVLANLPCGSVVVAASDVLLSLPLQNPIDFEKLSDNNKVIGLAVPAPLETAQNHGVFVLGEQEDEDCDDNIKPIDAFLQKPSVKSMKNFSSGKCIFEEKKKLMAWIDTGVIIFLPKAAQVLRKMINEDLGVCTQSGLEKLYENRNVNGMKEQNHFGKAQINIAEFAKKSSVKVELYSHLLLAIPTRGSIAMNNKVRLNNYLCDAMNRDLDSDLLQYIFHSFSRFELKVCIIPGGSFIHLGTTNELRRFLIHGASTSYRSEKYDDIHRCQDFGNRLGIVHKSLVTANDIHFDPSAVAINSYFSSTCDTVAKRSIGSGSVVEHSTFYENELKIGSNCLISGLRGIWRGQINIPDNSVFQLVKLKSSWKEILGFDLYDNEEESFVCIYHNINDEIKSYTTCFGVSFEDFFRHTGLSHDDMWEHQEKEKLLWNAKINPIITINSREGQIEWSMFSWIENLGSPLKNGFKKSLDVWKSHKRISLSQLRSVADASFEFSSRKKLQSALKNLTKVQLSLLNRGNEEIDLSPALYNDDIFLIYLGMLEDIVANSILNDTNDISSRALMLISNLLRDFLTEHNEELQNSNENFYNINNEVKILPLFNGDKDKKKNAWQSIIKYRKKLTSYHTVKEKLLQYANIMEEIGHSFTKDCVASGITITRQEPYEYCSPGSWVVAKAPARIDIFGGWSDTPPISYEHGGSVACLAVLVNKKKPLSARCRLISKASGIILRTESRDIDTNEVLWSEKVHIHQINELIDHNDPTASCAILKCALLIYGLLPLEILNDHERHKESIQPFLDKLCNKSGFGLELISVSLLPKGSGMGSSSILAGCILASLGRCLGLNFDYCQDEKGLIKGVLLLEQLLTTGGGWQDQVGGLYGGLKVGTSRKHQLPMELKIQEYDIPPDTIVELNKRMILIFMGQPRLAKNILRNVLKKWSTRHHLIMNTVKDLVSGSHDAVKALQTNDVCGLGKLLSLYWQKKKTMAGNDSGVEPEGIRETIKILEDNNIIDGATLCGAGGGGILIAIIKKDRTRIEAKQCLNSYASTTNINIDSFLFYECEISCDGLSISIEESSDTA